MAPNISPLSRQEFNHGFDSSIRFEVQNTSSFLLRLFHLFRKKSLPPCRALFPAEEKEESDFRVNPANCQSQISDCQKLSIVRIGSFVFMDSGKLWLRVGKDKGKKVREKRTA